LLLCYCPYQIMDAAKNAVAGAGAALRDDGGSLSCLFCSFRSFFLALKSVS
jgi:hypothetical protein